MIRGQGGMIGAQMIDASTGAAFVGTVSAFITGDGGTQGAATNSCTAEGNGYYSVVLTNSESDYALIAVTFTGTGAIPATIQIFTEPVPSLTPTGGGPATSAVTALELIADAFALLNVFLPGESIPASDGQFGLRSLNGLLGSWAQMRLTIPTVARLTFDLVIDQGSPANPYTIGSGGDFDTPRPANATALRSASILIPGTTPNEIPLTVMTPALWEALTIKTMSGALPTAIFLDPTFTAGLGRIYLWPQPSVDTNQLVLYVEAALSTFADLTTAYQLPPGYKDALVYNLAKRLALPYGRAVDPMLNEQAAESLRLIKRSNVTMVTMVPWLPTSSYYDINSGTTFTR